MNIEEVRLYALSLPFVTEDLPFGPDVLTFRVGNKIFMAVGLDSLEPICALKLSPEDGAELREHHDGIQPAYHWNKKYWNDVYLDVIDGELVKRLIKQSYELVFDGLPKKVKEGLV